MALKHFLIRLLSVILTLFMLPTGSIAAEEAAEPVGRTPVSYGIDVSRWQGEVDFVAVKADGIDFVILRVGYWDTKDVNFDTYYANAKDAGLDIGVYIYSYSETEDQAAFEAQNVLSWIEGKTLEYPVYYDIEDEEQANLTNKERTALCLSFARVISAGGYYPGVYANENWYNNYLVRDELSHLPLWIAKWTSDGAPVPDPGEPYGMWQYSASGKVDGIQNSVDMNVCYTDYPAYIKGQGLNGYPSLPFTDVAHGSWYYDYIRYTYDNGLFNGMSPDTFAPALSVTRGMFVTVLGRMSEVDTAVYDTSPFLDVDMNKYYGAYVTWAYESGITDGMGRDLFCPDELITREQMCKMIAGYTRLCGATLTPATSLFTDDAKISSWAKDSVYLLSGSGIINGVSPGVFSAKTDATRAQCAAIITRVDEFITE